MKKFIAFFSIIVIACIACGCSSSIKRITNTAITDEFQESIREIYRNEDGVESLFIPSFGTDKSALKTLSLHNLCKTAYAGTITFDTDRNIYRCSIEASLYSGRNRVMVDLLTNEATEEEFYEAYRVASIIKDETLMKNINNRYNNYNHFSTGTLSDRVYRSLNESYLYEECDQDNKELTDDVIEYIKSYMITEYLDTTFDALSDLTASIAFLQKSNIHSEDNLLLELYHYYTSAKNERIMVFEPDVSFEYYCRIIYMLRDILSIHDGDDFFAELASCGAELYSGLSYDITTAKNFATYVISLSYTDISISKEHLSLLKRIHQQIVADIQIDDYYSVFYVNLASDFLGTDKVHIPISKEEKTLSYLWATKQKKEFSELYVPNADIVQSLMICDSSYETEQRNNLLESINIFDYVDEEGFSQILNLYVCVMSNSHLLTSDLRSNIYEYIHNEECIFGYSEYKGGYDFRSSVYYTNIKYILEGGEDIGLR